MFKLSQEDYQKILNHAIHNLPEEACGLITGTDENGIRTASRVYLLENKDHSAEHFTISPEDQLQVLLDSRKNGEKVIGTWHSHPSTPSRMSQEDIRLARDENRSYLILSLMEKTSVIHAFRMKNGQVFNEELQIIKE